MRVVPTLLHGVADYAVSLLVLSIPFAFGLSSSLSGLYILLGLFGIGYSLVTQYELSLARLLPLHLMLDAVFGLVMLLIAAFAPLADGAFWVTLIIGVLALLLAATTKLTPRQTLKGSAARCTGNRPKRQPARGRLRARSAPCVGRQKPGAAPSSASAVRT